MLDEFSAVKLEASKPAAPSAQPEPAAATVTDEQVLSEDDFAQQLQAGMADLLGELGDSVRCTWDPTPLAPLTLSKPEMQAQFESIFKELGAAATANADPATSAPTPPVPTSSSTTGGTANPAEDSFQETIRRTMERMQNSGDQATAAAAAEGSDDFLAELLKQMQGGGGLDGEGNEEEFSKMLMGMMEQLTNKEILYEPMKELNDKFPEWLDKNREKTPADDLKRYEEQQTLVREIVAKFEESTYADSNTADREYIVDRMQKVSCTKLQLPRIGADSGTRCKLPGHPQATLSRTCRLRKTCSTCQTTRAIPNRSVLPGDRNTALQLVRIP
jgi:peroxin-19